MKKLVALVLVLLICFGLFSALAAEAGAVRIIPVGDDLESSLDDVLLNKPVEIPDSVRITFTSFEYIDKLGFQANWVPRIKEYLDYIDTFVGDGFFESGADAEYAILRTDILNMTENA